MEKQELECDGSLYMSLVFCNCKVGHRVFPSHQEVALCPHPLVLADCVLYLANGPSANAMQAKDES